MTAACAAAATVSVRWRAATSPSGSVVWRTPPALFLALHREFDFTIDVAAEAGNAHCDRFFDCDADALAQSWAGERVWCNPPYSRLEPWVAKAWRAMLEEGADRVVMLLPANRCEQRWWQEYVEPYRDGGVRSGVRLTTQFLAGRTRFRMPPDHQYYTVKAKGDRPPFGCVLLTWTRP